MAEYESYSFDGSRFKKWTEKETPTEDGSPAKQELSWEYVKDRREIGPAIQNITEQYLRNEISADELGEAIRGAFNIYSTTGLRKEDPGFLQRYIKDDPTVIGIGILALKHLAREIWGDKVDTYDKNAKHPDVPVESPDVMQNTTRTQGTGKTDSDKKKGGDPVILFSGQLLHNVTDLQVKGRGLDFTFSRTYLHQAIYKGPLGYCWDHSYNLWLREDYETLPDGSRRNVVYRSTGTLREDKYTQVLETPIGELAPLNRFADAVFHAPPGFFDRLEKQGDRYFFETAIGLRFEYNRDLYIDRMIDPNGNQILFRYNESKLLTRIIDPVGKEFLLEYDEMNRIHILYDKVGNRKIKYYYGDNGDLEEVDVFFEPDLIAGIDYRYLGPDYPNELQHSMTEIINPMGQSILENEYGMIPGSLENNRVVRQRSADGEYRYEYGFLPDHRHDPTLNPINIPVTFTNVFYPNGHKIENWFNRQGNIVRKTEQILGISSEIIDLVFEYRYNEDGLLLEEFRPDGSAIGYHYQREEYARLHGDDTSSATARERLTFGNLLRRVEKPKIGIGEKQRIVTDFTYTAGNRVESQRGPYYADAFLNPLSKEKISEVKYGYDSHGNLATLGFGKVHLPDKIVQTLAITRFSYNSNGVCTDFFRDALHIKYITFPDEQRSGFVKEVIEESDGIERRVRYDVDDLGRIKGITGHYGDQTDIEWTTFDTPKNIIQPEVFAGAPRPVISYRYDRNRQVTQIMEELKLYDGTSHPDRSLVTSYRYDAYGRLIEQLLGPAARPSARKRKTTYTPFNLPEKNIDFLENVTFTTYNERMLPFSITKGWSSSEKSVMKILYNISSKPALIIDSRKNKTIIEYDDFGRTHIIRDPDGNESVTDYDAADRVIRSRLYGIDPDTHIKVRWSDVEFHYDAAGRLIERMDHLFIPGVDDDPGKLLSTQFFYDPLNRVETIVYSNGTKMHYTHDGRNRLMSSTDSDNNQTKYLYDDKSHTLTIIDKDVGKNSEGRLITQYFQRITQFNNRDLPVTETDNLGNIIKRGYNSQNLLAYFEDSSAHKYFNDYNTFGQLIKSRTDVEGHNLQTRIDYDSNGNIKSVTSPTKGTTVWTYDSLNRIKRVDRNGTYTSYQYDRESNIVFQEDSNGISVTNSYTPAGFLKTREPDMSAFSPPTGLPTYTPSIGSVLNFLYTPFGDITSAVNDKDTIVRKYDSMGRVLEERTGRGNISYRYDNSGHVKGLIFPNGRHIKFDYTPAGFLKEISQISSGSGYPGNRSLPSSRVLMSFWRIGNRLLMMRFGNSHYANISYDAGKRIVAFDWTRISDSKPFHRERNLYERNGEWKLHQSDSVTRLFEYDELHRLQEVTDYEGVPLTDISSIVPPPIMEAGAEPRKKQLKIDALISTLKMAATSISGSLIRKFSYDLDDNENRIETSELIGSGATSEKTRYIPDTNDMYQNVGSKLILYDRMGNMLCDGTNTYKYDVYNNLSEIKNSSGLVQLSHDALFRLISSKSEDGIDEFVFAGPHHSIIEWRKNSSLQGQIVPLEGPFQYSHLAYNKIDSAPIFDAVKSVVGWINSEGHQYSSSMYDPFGQVLKRDSNWPTDFGFAGYQYNRQAKVYHLPRRDYHPSFGRYLQLDPAGLVDGTNAYAYAHHSPGTLVDSSGLKAESSQNASGSGSSSEDLSTSQDVKTTGSSAGDFILGALAPIGNAYLSYLKNLVNPLRTIFTTIETVSSMYDAYKKESNIIDKVTAAVNVVNPAYSGLLAAHNAIDAFETKNSYEAGKNLTEAALGAVGTVGIATGAAGGIMKGLGSIPKGSISRFLADTRGSIGFAESEVAAVPPRTPTVPPSSLPVPPRSSPLPRQSDWTINQSHLNHVNAQSWINFVETQGPDFQAWIRQNPTGWMQRGNALQQMLGGSLEANTATSEVTVGIRQPPGVSVPDFLHIGPRAARPFGDVFPLNPRQLHLHLDARWYGPYTHPLVYVQPPPGWNPIIPPRFLSR